VKGARIIIRTGWDKVFPDENYFSDCPGIVPDACKYLAEREIATVAMDMPTILGSEYVDVHHCLLGKEILVVEGLANLDKLESDRVLFSALPLRIKGRDGSPCRAVAVEGLPPVSLSTMAGPSLFSSSDSVCGDVLAQRGIGPH
jgi:kynurenine formamidase